MKDRIQNAYDAIQPGEETYDAMLARVQSRQGRQHRRVSRGILRLAACVAGLAALTVGAYAAVQAWVLPKPETYTPDPESGVVSIHSTETYTEIPTTAPEAETAPGQPALDDAFFLARAGEVLAQVGLQDVDQSRMTVTRQENLFWAREEAEVTFTEDENRTSVRFDAESGFLLGLSNVEWIDAPEGTACSTREEAIALAEEFYRSLPVPQGYEYTDCTEYDEQYWTLEFCRRVQDDLFNPYEMVRISINPVSGRLNGLTVFYVPLLDDHGPGDQPLTLAQALAAAEACPYANLEGRELESAEIGVILPNWWFTEYMADSANARASTVSRLGWALIYENHDSEYADILRIYVDLYTGEILGGDMT